MNKATLETDYWVLLGILLGALGFLLAYLFDAFIHYTRSNEQSSYAFWVQTQSLSNWSIYLLAAVFIAGFGLFLLHMYVTSET